jgi:hypothetical protein
MTAFRPSNVSFRAGVEKMAVTGVALIGSPREIEKLERPVAPFSFLCVLDAALAGTLRLNSGAIVKAVRNETRSVVDLLLACSSVEAFRTERNKVFGKYSLFAKALSKLVLTDADPQTHQQLVQGSLAAQEKKLKEFGADLFGIESTTEAVFSLVTLRRAYKLIPAILAKPADREDEDQKLSREFGSAALWASLHLDVLMAAISKKKILTSEVLAEILSGLRLALSAYAFAREGYNIRYPAQERSMFPVTTWDAEDQALANLSTDERETTIPDGY